MLSLTACALFLNGTPSPVTFCSCGYAAAFESQVMLCTGKLRFMYSAGRLVEGITMVVTLSCLSQPMLYEINDMHCDA